MAWARGCGAACARREPCALRARSIRSGGSLRSPQATAGAHRSGNGPQGRSQEQRPKAGRGRLHGAPACPDEATRTTADARLPTGLKDRRTRGLEERRKWVTAVIRYSSRTTLLRSVRTRRAASQVHAGNPCRGVWLDASFCLSDDDNATRVQPTRARGAAAAAAAAAPQPCAAVVGWGSRRCCVHHVCALPWFCECCCG